MERNDTNQVKICVAGVGAIGGLLAAMLGKHGNAELSVIARGARAASFAENGIVLHSDFYGDTTARPAHIAENGRDLPVQDYVLVCVKNYSLAQIAEQIAPCIDAHTVLLPVMNGIEASDFLRARFPENTVGDSVIYTITAAHDDFTVHQAGAYTHVFMGTKEKDAAREAALRALWKIMQDVGLDCRWSDDIVSQTWQKYILNCAFNSVTALYQTDVGGIRTVPSRCEELHAIFEEAAAVARALAIALPDNYVEKNYTFITKKQAADATSSMKRDVEAGRRTELDAILGALLRNAEKARIDTPVCRRVCDALAKLTGEA